MEPDIGGLYGPHGAINGDGDGLSRLPWSARVKLKAPVRQLMDKLARVL